jgi:uncharacterized protein YktB (UPF0637 family)
MPSKSKLGPIVDFMNKVQTDPQFRDALLNKNEEALTKYMKDDFKFDDEKTKAVISMVQRIDTHAVYAFVARLEDAKN